MKRPPVSVVVVSRDRPEALKRCVLGLGQVQYAPFEIVVVADPQGIAAVEGMDCASDLKLVLFDEPNISAARNAGIDAAAGEIIAFIDDDAVPEPTWLHYLTLPYGASDVAATGGFVRGRNGISFQWKARMIDALGHAHPIDVKEDSATVLTSPKGQAVKTEGTNMSVRRDILVEMGGFDPAYHFYLDETDLNMRLAQEGHSTAICPRAQVHHGFAASTRRRQDRVPADLFDIGASWAVFARKFLHENMRVDHWKKIVMSERKRLLTHMVAGRLEPAQVRRLMKRLRAGQKEGLTRKLGAGQIASHAADGFKTYPATSREVVYLLASRSGKKAAQKQAALRVKNGALVTLIVLSRTAMYHRVGFDGDGVWVQDGGQFGRSDRDQRVWRWTRRKKRFAEEVSRVDTIRGKGDAKLAR